MATKLRPGSRTRGNDAFDGGVSIGNGALVFTNAGAPTDGTSGTYAGRAGPGSVLSDVTNTNLYINTGTLASPTWTVVGTQS